VHVVGVVTARRLDVALDVVVVGALDLVVAVALDVVVVGTLDLVVAVTLDVVVGTLDLVVAVTLDVVVGTLDLVVAVTLDIVVLVDRRVELGALLAHGASPLSPRPQWP
jgi:hypothetical protein